MNRIRQVNLSDIPALQELYQHTVLTVNRKDYTAEEVADWASCGDDTSHWVSFSKSNIMWLQKMKKV